MIEPQAIYRPWLWINILLASQVSWWRHETCSALLALCDGNPTMTSGLPHKGQDIALLLLHCLPEQAVEQISIYRRFQTPNSSWHINVTVLLWNGKKTNILCNWTTAEVMIYMNKISPTSCIFWKIMIPHWLWVVPLQASVHTSWYSRVPL